MHIYIYNIVTFSVVLTSYSHRYKIIILHFCNSLQKMLKPLKMFTMLSFHEKNVHSRISLCVDNSWTWAHDLRYI